MKRRSYKYVVIDEDGRVVIATDHLYHALGEGERLNLTVKERLLPDVKVGKRVIKRWRVIREISNQVDMFKHQRDLPQWRKP